MKKLTIIAAAAAAILSSCQARQQVEANYAVIPLPKQVETVADQGDKPFVLRPSTVIVAPADLAKEADMLAGYIKTMTSMDLKVAIDEAPKANAIELKADLEAENPEAYEITVTDKLIQINGATAAGTFYGMQTLRKAIPAAGDHNVAFAPVKISDFPRFGYRGVHFDVARHFFPVDTVKSYIDMIALHNANRLHLHLTDDQGWRIEIKKHPELVEKGSIRKGTCIGNDLNSCDSIPYGGFYTQDELRDLVAYAADRHIVIVPEIDMPGHMLGALAAYPELGCTGGPYEVWTRWGVSNDVLCAGNPDTYALVDDVLDEVMEIFPSEYIHIGGDECPKARWKECPKCQAKIKELGLKADKNSSAEAKLQTYFMSHATDYLSNHGRKAIGWDEIIEGGISDGVTVMSWRGTRGAKRAVEEGHDAILTPAQYCYFDYVQADPTYETPVGWAPLLTIDKVYEFEPVDPAFDAEQAARVLGLQANVWTERMPTYDYVQIKVLPRLAALSEVQWVDPSQKDVESFHARLPQLLATYDAIPYAYFVAPEPETPEEAEEAVVAEEVATDLSTTAEE